MEAKDNPPKKKSIIRKRMVSIPLLLHDWVDKGSKALARKSGSEPNFSSYLSGIILDAKTKADAERRARRAQQN